MNHCCWHRWYCSLAHFKVGMARAFYGFGSKCECSTNSQELK